MKWIKVEEGCEMPGEGDVVLAVEEVGGDRDWFECEYRNGKFKWTGMDEAFSAGEVCAIYWARVEMPEE